MTDVIDFLERMGQDAQLRHAAQDEVELALNSAEIAPELQTAILARDQAQLEKLLGQDPLCGMLFPGKEDEQEDEDTEETPSRDNEHEEQIRRSLSGNQVSAG
jgi:hypothetical protein